MVAAWVQKDANWGGFLSSHLGQLNSPGRNTLETSFSFFKLPLNFSDQKKEVKNARPRGNTGRTATWALWAGRLASVRGPVWYSFSRVPFILHFQPMRKRWPGKTLRETPKNKKNIYKILTLFYVLGLTFGLFLHGEDINMVKRHNVGFVINLRSLTIHHELITFHIYDG
jgi:hypothetical protein